MTHWGSFEKTDIGLWRTAPAQRPICRSHRGDGIRSPSPTQSLSFVEGIRTITTAGDAGTQAGMGTHVYLITRSMADEYFYNADAEMLFVPQQGDLRMWTEFGIIDIEPGEIAIIPRGVKIRVELRDGPARGYLCENYGGAFTLPERGPIGANCLANPRDFLTPVAAYEDKDVAVAHDREVGRRALGTDMAHSPLDVVAWHGNYAPYKYDLRRFSPVGPVLFDHADPSIFTVLTSPSETPGTANVDFVLFSDRWMVAENTFRPPWYHMNVMSEFMGLVYGRTTPSRGFRARRRLAAQHDAAARPGRRCVRERQQCRAEAAQARRHAGVHARNPISPADHAIRGRDGRAAEGLCRLRAQAEEALRSRSAVIRTAADGAGAAHEACGARFL